MIMKQLLDREEVRENKVWYVVELFTVKCPKCGRDTSITCTYPDYTEYHHAFDDCCVVRWTEEPGFSQLVVPGYIRD